MSGHHPRAARQPRPPADGQRHHLHLQQLTWTMVGPRAVLAPRDALVLADDVPDGVAPRPGR